MKYCKDCVGFDECKTIGRTVEFAVDDGVCIDFDERKPQTNADRIRSMTDRELADFFYGIRECSVCAYNYEDRCVRCSDGIFKWLQNPAEKPKEDA